ncbi:hypothetical protein D3C75_922670 [compost metagenome]
MTDTDHLPVMREQGVLVFDLRFCGNGCWSGIITGLLPEGLPFSATGIPPERLTDILIRFFSEHSDFLSIIYERVTR